MRGDSTCDDHAHAASVPGTCESGTGGKSATNFVCASSASRRCASTFAAHHALSCCASRQVELVELAVGRRPGRVDVQRLAHVVDGGLRLPGEQEQLDDDPAVLVVLRRRQARGAAERVERARVVDDAIAIDEAQLVVERVLEAAVAPLEDAAQHAPVRDLQLAPVAHVRPDAHDPLEGVEPRVVEIEHLLVGLRGAARVAHLLAQHAGARVEVLGAARGVRLQIAEHPQAVDELLPVADRLPERDEARDERRVPGPALERLLEDGDRAQRLSGVLLPDLRRVHEAGLPLAIVLDDAGEAVLAVGGARPVVALREDARQRGERHHGCRPGGRARGTGARRPRGGRPWPAAPRRGARGPRARGPSPRAPPAPRWRRGGHGARRGRAARGTRAGRRSARRCPTAPGRAPPPRP